MFRGRETTHPERGRDLLMRLAEDVKEVGQVESPPLLDGRNMVMVLAPTKNAGVRRDDAKAEDTQQHEEAVPTDGERQADAPPQIPDDASGPPGEGQGRQAEARPAS
jgi:translation initiation factor IF-3